MPKILVLTFVSAFIFNVCSPKIESTPVQSAGRNLDFVGTLDFVDETSSVISTIDIAVADDDMTRSQGLMDVRELKSDGGMLFIFEAETRQSFWMANTPLPLDLIFVDMDKKIVHIHQNATPFSQSGIDSVNPAMYVVEVNAGYAVNHDLKPGQTISFNY
ncbi:MAG TPA: DUF192 domain-containing protein [Bacteroidetes bacterium]|nr:DUF192 domain-containing protein [Bacteroidota bacterium]